MNSRKYLDALYEKVDFQITRKNVRLDRLDATLINPKDDYLMGKIEGFIECLEELISEIEEGEYNG